MKVTGCRNLSAEQRTGLSNSVNSGKRYLMNAGICGCRPAEKKNSVWHLKINLVSMHFRCCHTALGKIYGAVCFFITNLPAVLCAGSLQTGTTLYCGR